jgi:hypothetical protein
VWLDKFEALTASEWGQLCGMGFYLIGNRAALLSKPIDCHGQGLRMQL